MNRGRLKMLTLALIGLVGYAGWACWNQRQANQPLEVAQIQLGVQGDFDGQGMFIMFVRPGSWAWLVGIEIGDRITHINGKPIKNKPVWVQEVNDSDGFMTLTILRGRTQRVETVQIVM